MSNKGIALLLSLLCFTALAGSYKTADDLYDNKEFDKAFQAYKNLATIGDAFSQYRLGYMYLNGEGVKVDYAKAVAWMRVAANNSPDMGADEQADKVINYLKAQGIEVDVDSATSALLSQYSQQSISQKFSPVFLEDKDCKVRALKWLERTPPKYPSRAQRSGAVGVLRIQFNASSEGYPRDIELIGQTDKVFKRSAIKAVKSWKGKPSGSPGLQAEGWTVQLDFNLEGTTANKAKVDKVLSGLQQKAEGGDAVAQYQLATTLSFWQGKLKKLGYKHSSFKDSGKWHHKAAQKGHPIARYELGKNMIQGKGCEEDVEGGLAWLRASAIAGYGPAQGELARQLLKKPDSDLEEVLQLLRDASEGGHYLSSINLAWLLATHPNPTIRNGEEALEHLDKESEYYFDEVRLLETKAAAYAALGNFRKAASYQDDAIDEAEDLDWDIPVMKQRYKTYKAKKLWLGEYYL